MTGVTEREVAGRLLMDALLVRRIGRERPVHGRPAGFRKRSLFCIAAPARFPAITPVRGRG